MKLGEVLRLFFVLKEEASLRVKWVLDGMKK